MSDNGMVPRLVVPDDDDAEVLAKALIGFIIGNFQRVSLTGDLISAITDGRRAVEMLGAIQEAAEADHAKRHFGSVPDDDEMASHLDKLRKEFGPEAE